MLTGDLLVPADPMIPCYYGVNLAPRSLPEQGMITHHEPLVFICNVEGVDDNVMRTWFSRTAYILVMKLGGEVCAVRADNVVELFR